MQKAFWDLFTVGSITIGSIICFYSHLYIIAAPLLLWAVVRLTGYAIDDLRAEANDFSTVLIEDMYSNVSLTFEIDISKVLQHPDTLKVVEKLRSQKIFSSNVDQETWINQMLQSYKTTVGKDSGWEQVSFDIQKGILWKNEKVTSQEAIHHEIDIPCPESLIDLEYKEKNTWKFGSRNIRIFNNFSIRLLLVNGILKLQIGRLDQITSFDVIKGGDLGEYEQWHTITSFPLIYCYRHGIPLKYLFLNYRAIPECIKHDEAWVDIWNKLNEEASSYRFLLQNKERDFSLSEKDNTKILRKWERIAKDFKQKLEAWSQREGFEDLNASQYKDYLFGKYARMETAYRNQYMVIRAFDLSALHKENRREFFTDYYEETL